MKDLIIFAPVAMIALAVLLSISAFYGGFHFAHVRFLTKFKPLNDHIVSSGDNETLMATNEFLASIQVEKNKVKFVDWFKFGFLGRGR